VEDSGGVSICPSNIDSVTGLLTKSKTGKIIIKNSMGNKSFFVLSIFTGI